MNVAPVIGEFFLPVIGQRQVEPAAFDQSTFGRSGREGGTARHDEFVVAMHSSV